MTNGISNQTLRTLLVVVTMVIVSASLGGKRRCFCVLVAHLHNLTNCNPLTGHPCSISTLNWIGDFGAAVSYLGTSLISNLLRGSYVRQTGSVGTGGGGSGSEGSLMPGHQHYQDSRVLLQCGLLLVLGCTLSSLINTYDSLVLTDSLLQGLGASALMSIASLRLENVFPRSHRLHVLAQALSDGAPWGMLVMCPIYSSILTHLPNWQMLYSVLACIFIVECGLSSMVASEVDEMSDSDSVIEPPKVSPPPPFPLQSPTTEEALEGKNDMELLETVYASPVMYDSAAVPHYSEYITLDNLAHLLSKQVIAMWCMERVLITMVTYGVVLNMVDYIRSQFDYQLQGPESSLDQATHITLTFAGAETLGFVVAIIVGESHLPRKRLLMLTMTSAIFSAILLFTWQMIHTYRSNNYGADDVHVIVCLLGLVTAMGSCYTYKLGEDITGKPYYVSQMMTSMSQAMGLFLAPLTSGMLIQVDGYDSFFIVQSALSIARVALIGAIMYQFHQKSLRTLSHG